MPSNAPINHDLARAHNDQLALSKINALKQLEMVLARAFDLDPATLREVRLITGQILRTAFLRIREKASSDSAAASGLKTVVPHSAPARKSQGEEAAQPRQSAPNETAPDGKTQGATHKAAPRRLTRRERRAASRALAQQRAPAPTADTTPPDAHSAPAPQGASRKTHAESPSVRAPPLAA